MFHKGIASLVFNKQGRAVIEPILNSTNTGIIIIDAKGNLVYVNRICEEIFHIRSEDISGIHYNEVFAQIPPGERYTLITLETGQEFENVGSEKARFNNLYITTDTMLLRDEQGNTIGAVGIFKNITPIYEFHKRLSESCKLSMLGNVAAGMAHEILNPLTTSRGLVQILNQKAGDNNLPKEKVKEYTDIILKELDSIHSLVKRFTHMSKSKALDMKPVNLDQLVHMSVSLVADQLKEKRIQVVSKLQAGAIILGDMISLKLALLQILDNSLEFLPCGAMINISTELSGNEALLIVSDNGPGIQHDILDNVFMPFFTTREEKTGLGLTIAQRIIHTHKGLIRVESEPGKGANFIISLPLVNSFLL